MKKLIALLSIITFTHCHKDVNNSFREQLSGTWELRVQFFGLGGSASFPSGNSNRIIFNTGGQYTATGPVSGNSTYTLSTWANPLGEMGNLLQLNALQQGNSTYNHQFEAHISHDTLRLDNYSTIADGPSYFYVKQ